MNYAKFGCFYSYYAYMHVDMLINYPFVYQRATVCITKCCSLHFYPLQHLIVVETLYVNLVTFLTTWVAGLPFLEVHL